MSYKTFLFLLLLLAIGLLGYMRYQAAGNPNSYFNQTTRFKLAKSEFWRWALGMHLVGDARAEYLAGGEPIVIEAVNSKQLDIDNEGLQKFANQVSRITGRKTTVINVDTITNLTVSDADLPSLVANFRRHKSYGQPDIFIIYAEDFQGSDTAGPSKPFDSFGIVVSDKKLKDLTSQYSQAIREYLPATLLHSFGYQLGLPDSQDSNCIMQPEVQIPTSALIFYAKQLPDAYCDSEIDQAKRIASGF